MDIKLSIVIPYYDTYDYTIKLLKELSMQKTADVEIILITDGLNEKLFDIFKDINIVHRDKNYGASNAWNTGIDLANGKYIAFIDSDDIITMDYIDVLIDTINNHDEDVKVFNWADFNKTIIVKHPQNRGIWKAIYKKEICPHFDEAWICETDKPFQESLGTLSFFNFNMREGALRHVLRYLFFNSKKVNQFKFLLLI